MPNVRGLVAIALLLVAAPAAAGGYTVQWGDTLSGIARRLGVSVSALAQANAITNLDKVYAGRNLKLPAANAAGAPVMQLASSTQPATTGFHTVAPGETLSRIAAKYGLPTADLARMNGISDPNMVRIGKQLSVPGGAPWQCPVEGADRWSFIDSFGAPRPSGPHMGIDIFAKRGTAVLANTGGTLRHVRGARAGNAYYLEGDDGLTYYGAHL